jgi:nicotinamide riboside kinase
LKSKVINLLGGPGIGKTGTAHGISYYMKLKHKRVEYVNEFVKTWAYTGQEIGPYDQVYIFGNQAKREHDLYHRVDYIVTDSPLILSPIYEMKLQGYSIILDSVLKHIEKAQKNGIEFQNYLIRRPTKYQYDTVGRWGTEEDAIKMDAFIESKLKELKVPYLIVEEEQEQRVDKILKLMVESH